MTALHAFQYLSGEMYCEDVPLTEIARRFGTPTYVYSGTAISQNFERLRKAFLPVSPIFFFAVKANSNLAVLKLLAQQGISFDIVSGGELFRLRKIGIPPEKIIYSGVGKTFEELRIAVEAGLFGLVVESLPELEILKELSASLGKKIRVSLRINPDVEVPTHPYISTGLRKHKFGLDSSSLTQALQILDGKRSSLDLIGIGSHIGSQILSIEPYKEAFIKIREYAQDIRAQGFPVKYLDLGGGFGIPYGQESDIDLKGLADFLERESEDYRLALEPGRYIVGAAGLLLNRVLYHKINHDKHFFIVDGAMNDLIRPTLYDAHHRILPIIENNRGTVLSDVVGPVCESSDFFARDRVLPRFASNELLAVMDAGAYGFVASSNYNSRPRAAEVLVQGDRALLVRRRETLEDLIQGEYFQEIT